MEFSTRWKRGRDTLKLVCIKFSVPEMDEYVINEEVACCNLSIYVKMVC